MPWCAEFHSVVLKLDAHVMLISPHVDFEEHLACSIDTGIHYLTVRCTRVRSSSESYKDLLVPAAYKVLNGATDH